MVQYCEQVFDSKAFTSKSKSHTEKVTTAGICRLEKLAVQTEGYRDLFLLAEQTKVHTRMHWARLQT